MGKVLSALVVGCLATFTMDVLNFGAAHFGLVSPVSHEVIGRLISSWLTGTFVHDSPAELPVFALGEQLGYFYHYAIGTTLAAGILFLHKWRARAVKLHSAVLFGLATSLFSLFLAFPSMGLGPMGMNAGTGPLKMSLFNHLFFGIGLYLSKWLALEGEPTSPPLTATEAK